MSKYEVVERLWESAGFNITILQVPPDKIDDKLAILSDGSGLLTSFMYNRFLFNTCIVDPSKVWPFMGSLSENTDLVVSAVMDLKSLIIEANPLLDPRILIINDENIIRLPNQGDTTSTARLLINNPRWDDTNVESDDEEDIDNFFSNAEPPRLPLNVNPSIPWAEKLELKEWSTTGLVVLVLKCSVDDIPEVFKDKYSFANDDGGYEAYRLFIVAKTVADFAAMFQHLDEMGITKKNSPKELVRQLYELVIEENPFLAWESVDLDKVKRAVIAKYGKQQKPHLNKFSKDSVKGDKNTETKKQARLSKDFYREFSDVSEEEVNTLAERIKQEVIGQDPVIEEIVDSIKLAKCGFKEEGTPIATFLLTGESGVGKTHCAKMLAKYLTGDEHNLVRVDCSEYSHSHEISKLIGSPNGYIGSSDTTKFFEMMTKSPFSVVLFDELEKSHSKLHDLLLQAIDEGHLTNGKSETVSFGQAIFLFTSNIGVQEVKSVGSRIGIGDGAVVTRDKRAAAITEAVKDKFKPEFIGRLDGVLTFDVLNKDSCMRIVDLQFNRVNELLAKKDIRIEYDEAVKEYIYSRGFKKGYGARPLKRVVRKEVFLPVSKLLLEQKLSSKVVVKVGISEDKLTFSVEGKKSKKKKKEAAKIE